MDQRPPDAPLDLGAISALRLDPRDGIWRSASTAPVSYPESGNRECFAIEASSFWFAHRNEVLLDLLRRFPPAGPLFDVGGGNGFVALALQRAGQPVVLIEPGAQGATNARARGLANVACATFTDAGFVAGTLAAVGLFDVLEHIEDDAGFVAELARCLRPGGWLYLTVPAHAWLWSAEDRDAGHFRRYRRRTLTAVLESSGLDVAWMSHFFTWLPMPIWLLRSLPSRFGRGDAKRGAAIAGQHRLPGGLAGRMLARWLARERRALARARRYAFGASLAAVARTPSAGER
jgi:SAM-dependent methyltransferase